MTQSYINQTTIFNIHNAVATITLNQPKKHNAFDDTVINELLAHLKSIANDPKIRILILKAEGKHFCAGADLDWMKRMGQLDFAENQLDAKNLAKLMSTLNNLPIPTVVKVQGAAYGGAIGLIACCDIAIASDTARFCLSEVKLGLAPATIGPYVLDAMGARRCRDLFLTARVFNASDAYDYGLLHQIAPLEELDKAIENTLIQVLQASPNACKAAKKLISDLSHNQGDPSEMTSELIAQLRVSEEGQEGLAAFFEKRLPSWRTS
ncbi:MAG: methylglutaconyl-CoA hydratase [Oleiphilaceae bacterium]|jgi:methylglutaconyl-CoA hydratase